MPLQWQCGHPLPRGWSSARRDMVAGEDSVDRQAQQLLQPLDPGRFSAYFREVICSLQTWR
jgi:hypothetical protein